MSVINPCANCPDRYPRLSRSCTGRRIKFYLPLILVLGREFTIQYEGEIILNSYRDLRSYLYCECWSLDRGEVCLGFWACFWGFWVPVRSLKGPEHRWVSTPLLRALKADDGKCKVAFKSWKGSSKKSKKSMSFDEVSWSLRSRSRSLVQTVDGCNKILNLSCSDESSVPSR